MRHARNRRARRGAHGARTRRPAPRSATRRKRLVGLAALAVLTVLALGVLRMGADDAPSAATAADRSPSPPASPSPSASASRTAEADGSPSASGSVRPEGKSRKKVPASPSSSASDSRVPKSGTGLFTTAAANGGPVGRGTIRRYAVQVEGGAGVSATEAAKEIAGILGDRRGWTSDGRDGFQLVASGPRDFEVKIATPDTVDAICGAAGLHTRGEVNCDVGDQVVVNLKRWLTGSPQFPGPLHEYRALIINHEVGHRIGRGHESCPGPGRPAPAMMQQIDGLHGCRANAWPYDGNGTYLGGPSVP